MALKILDCARVLPNGGCSLILMGEPDEVLRTYAQHRKDRQHAVETVEPGREPDKQLQNVVSVLEGKLYVGDEFELRDDRTTIHVPGPGVLLRRFGEGSVSASCACTGGAPFGTCKLEAGGHIATCLNATCTTCAWDVTTTGFAPDETFLPEFLEA